jgi:hypothetical protein
MSCHPILSHPLSSLNPLFVSLHEKQPLLCPSQPVRCLQNESISVLVGEQDHSYIINAPKEGMTPSSIYAASPFCASLKCYYRFRSESCINMPTSTLVCDENGE